MEFQNRLKELMDEKEFSGRDLAKVLSVNETTISGYFKRNLYPEIKIAIRICKFFGCSLDYLFGLSDDERIICELDENNVLSNFLNNFEHLKVSKNLNVVSIMKDLHMSEYNYYRWKKGRFPRTVNLIAVARYFDESIDELICHSL